MVATMVEFEREDGQKGQIEAKTFDRALTIRELLQNRWRKAVVSVIPPTPHVIPTEYQRINDMRLAHGRMSRVEELADEFDEKDEPKKLCEYLSKQEAV